MLSVRLFLAGVVLLGLSGCVNPYTASYVALPVDPSHLIKPDGMPHMVGHPEGMTPETMANDINHMYENGLVLIGKSYFCDTSVSFVYDSLSNYTYAAFQGGNVGADTVSGFRRYGGIDKIKTTLNATGETVEVIETVETTASPQSYCRAAHFYGRLVPNGVGLKVRKAAEEELAAAGISQGLVVEAVRNDSPAYQAHVLKGDFLLEAGGYGLAEAMDLDFVFASAKDIPVRLVLLRDNREVHKDILVPETWGAPPSDTAQRKCCEPRG